MNTLLTCRLFLLVVFIKVEMLSPIYTFNLAAVRIGFLDITNKANFQSVSGDDGFKVEVSVKTHFAQPVR